jgi:hypothetical protein|tara:strand:+ start:1984 stop:2547 length:564 start_codon:yes stop_codon:yes gene_type:complete
MTDFLYKSAKRKKVRKMAVYKRQPKETKRNYVWRVMHEQFGDTECSRNELLPFISKRSNVSYKNLSEQLSNLAQIGYATKRKCPSRKRTVYGRIIPNEKKWNLSHADAQDYNADHKKVNDVIEAVKPEHRVADVEDVPVGEVLLIMGVQRDDLLSVFDDLIYHTPIKTLRDTHPELLAMVLQYGRGA